MMQNHDIFSLHYLIRKKRKAVKQQRSIKQARKRKHIQGKDINLKTYKPSCIENGIDQWLADSKPAWSQLVAHLRVRRRIKRQKSSE